MTTFLHNLWSFLKSVLAFGKTTTENIQNSTMLGSKGLVQCDCKPLEIPDKEFVIRSIYYSVHVKKNGILKWQAYEPSPNTDEVSVMRGGCMTASECKRKAKEIENRSSNKFYRGLAVLSAGAIRGKGLDVLDSRAYFCGHGHILLGIKSSTDVGEPESSQYKEQLKDIARHLVDLSRY